jgi:hypothetical protein
MAGPRVPANAKAAGTKIIALLLLSDLAIAAV